MRADRRGPFDGGDPKEPTLPPAYGRGESPRSGETGQPAREGPREGLGEG